MKLVFLPFIMVGILFVGTLSAISESSKSKAPEANLPTTPAELLAFLTGTSWHLSSAVESYYGEGTLHFGDDGVVKHLYRDGELKSKQWGVTSDMKVIWGGDKLRVCKFSPDYKTFIGSRFKTTGKRVIRQDAAENGVTAKK